MIRYSVSPIYRGRVYRGIGYIAVACWTPFFWRPRARYFSRNRGNTLDPIRGRQFFAKSAHRDSLCSRFDGDNFSRNQLWPTWSETYFRQDLFPSYSFSRRQFHAIVIFRLKSISDLDSGSLPRFFGEFIYIKIKIVVSSQRLDVKWPKYARQWIGLGFELGLG